MSSERPQPLLCQFIQSDAKEEISSNNNNSTNNQQHDGREAIYKQLRRRHSCYLCDLRPTNYSPNRIMMMIPLLSSPLVIFTMLLYYALSPTSGAGSGNDERSSHDGSEHNQHILLSLHFLKMLLPWTFTCLIAVCIGNYVGCKPPSDDPSSRNAGLSSSREEEESSILTEEARQQIRANQDHFAVTLSKAIQLRTISYDKDDDDNTDNNNVTTDPKPLLQMHQLLRDSFPELHKRYPPKIIQQYSLLYIIPGGDDYDDSSSHCLLPIMLCAHLDVVPAALSTEYDDNSSWEHDPFSGKIIDGVIWGRGAIDNKHNVIAQLGALEHMIRNNVSFKRSVYVALGHDEEIGGSDGAANIAKYLKEKNHKVRFEGIFDEGSMMIRGAMPGLSKDVNVGLIACSEKGFLSMELTVRGPGGHSSMPPIQGDGGLINIMGKAVAKLEANPFPAHFGKHDYFRKNFEALAWRLSPPMRFLCSNLWLFGPLMKYILVRASNGAAAMVRTTTAVTKIMGGGKINSMPYIVSAHVNHRVHPSDTMASVLEHDRKVINDDRIEVRPLGFSTPAAPCSQTNTAAYNWIQRSVDEVFGNPCAPSLLTGNTDTRHYWGLSDNIYRFSPINLHISEVGMFHGSNERISVVALTQMVEYYETLLMMSCTHMSETG